MMRAAFAAIGLALGLALGAADPASSPRAPSIASGNPQTWIGVEMPAAGIDGAQGLAVRIAIRLGARHVIERDSAGGGFVNPHQDEGVDNDVDLRAAPAIIDRFAADPRVSAAIGGLRRRVGDADAAAAQARRLPAIVLARWSRNAHDADTYCVCVSPGRLVDFARAAARERYGPRLLVVLVGDAGALKPAWASRWESLTIAEVRDAAPSIATARSRARTTDAVLILADERPPTLWRSDVFVRSFDLDYVRLLGHRDFLSRPASAPPGSVATIEVRFPHTADLIAFEGRFHAVAGYLPSEAATRAHAAAQILTQSGTTRAHMRRALHSNRFSTVLGTLRFDPDGYAMPAPLALTPADSTP